LLYRDVSGFVKTGLPRGTQVIFWLAPFPDPEKTSTHAEFLAALRFKVVVGEIRWSVEYPGRKGAKFGLRSG
jgi:hypothetical protein